MCVRTVCRAWLWLLHAACLASWAFFPCGLQLSSECATECVRCGCGCCTCCLFGCKLRVSSNRVIVNREYCSASALLGRHNTQQLCFMAVVHMTAVLCCDCCCCWLLLFRRIPAPSGDVKGPLRLMLYDAFHDEYRWGGTEPWTTLIRTFCNAPCWALPAGGGGGGGGGGGSTGLLCTSPCSILSEVAQVLLTVPWL